MYLFVSEALLASKRFEKVYFLLLGFSGSLESSSILGTQLPNVASKASLRVPCLLVCQRNLHRVQKNRKGRSTFYCLDFQGHWGRPQCWVPSCQTWRQSLLVPCLPVCQRSPYRNPSRILELIDLSSVEFSHVFGFAVPPFQFSLLLGSLRKQIQLGILKLVRRDHLFQFYQIGSLDPSDTISSMKDIKRRSRLYVGLFKEQMCLFKFFKTPQTYGGRIDTGHAFVCGFRRSTFLTRPRRVHNSIRAFGY